MGYHDFFKRYYLKSRTIFDGPLSDPKISTKFLIDYLCVKLDTIT